ncbi:MAG: hypothetical protein ACOYN4_12825 [Bacteroidales bacterium]
MTNKFSKLSGQENFDMLRLSHLFMEYVGYEAIVDQTGLHVSYEFNLASKYTFRPNFKIPRKTFLHNFPTAETLKAPLFENLLFHIGLIELISYWKAACPPQVIIKGHKLTEKQVLFFKTVYYQGLGEFFYTNNISTSIDDFMEITSEGKNIGVQSIDLDETIIVPIGGGKDSVVTLELLAEISVIRPFIMNPRGATLECTRIAGYGNDEFLEVNRRIDPLLLELNANGFLNGHTPFSAMLAFYSLMVSAISGHKHIALSNESSANEPTVVGTDINHQYSKSFAFESDFRSYVKEFISVDFNYFSFLRPLNELQIARLFSKQEKYFPVFKSCNAGSKTDSWCCNCPKCLFAFTILSPFIPIDSLIRIFGKNLFELPQMLPFLRELTGIAEVKPFECVGTIDEVNAALQLVIAQFNGKKLPLLLEYYSNSGASNSHDLVLPNKVLNEFNDSHFLENNFLEILKQKLK